MGYVLDLARASRENPRVSLGLSTRGALSLLKAARVAAEPARRRLHFTRRCEGSGAVGHPPSHRADTGSGARERAGYRCRARPARRHTGAALIRSDDASRGTRLRTGRAHRGTRDRRAMDRERGGCVFWVWPAVLLVGGLIAERRLARGTTIRADIETAGRALLGRPQEGTFAFRNDSSRSVTLEFATAVPAGIEAVEEVRVVHAPGGGVGRDRVSLLPIRLGAQQWPAIPARLLGRFGLAWWNHSFEPARTISVAPDTLRTPRPRPSGKTTGMRPRRTVGAGSELHQLRAYVQGDPIARIDWKASARTRRLITREFTEDQHLDVLVAIDAGRLSRVRTGKLDRLGLYANVASRLAEVVTPNDDRVGLLVFSDRTLALCSPDRGYRGGDSCSSCAGAHDGAAGGVRSRRSGRAHSLDAQTPHARHPAH